ncbi:lipoprotein [Mycoplasma feriruminatoris]|uniref:lipoprotein n=1 Tax=Mycoplasma feriruminatoris TaxID=1179777 RepID=UPI00241F8663|nr:lipoprotein [Mycoplasma feriruminatoris]WFQ94499.1 hypothetical protein MFERI15220_00580 [Mycoplasma feriruminatoris]
MKKILTILGSLYLISATGSLVVACKTPQEIKNNLRELNNDVPKNEKQNKKEENQESEEKKQKELMQGDQLERTQPYMFKKDKRTNFSLIKKYGEKIWSVFYSNPEKLAKLNGEHSKNTLAKLARTITTYYNDIVKYSDLTEFELKEKVKLEDEGLFIKFDEAVANYEREEENIWNFINSL